MWNQEYFRELIDPGVIGMVHLQALPGSPAWQGDLATVCAAALSDASALSEAGIKAVMVENYNDVPFYPGIVPAETVAAMASIITTMAHEFPNLALGVNVLRNDAASALGIAVATGARFIRVNVHSGASVTDQGSIEGRAWHTLRLRRQLDAPKLGILADVRVKHALPLAGRPLGEEAQDLRLRGLADAVIVTGAATGSGANATDVETVREALPDCPILVGSGMTSATACDFFPQADGCIVGSSLKINDPDTGLPVVSVNKTQEFLAAFRQAQTEGIS
ncbi:MAG: BtpA/SgcQ family protein [bacterium]|nr:BtpA/SgcQ family protein [bacterium]